ncbi:MAG: glycosyltransferase family 2 protein [Verrucomicrobia bacterium]|nr:glycosyltransferase family 2 protein [Verrucomicrobiota bacterium]
MNPKVAIVLPAYNAEKTLRKTIEDIPGGCADYVIVVDDRSSDATVSLARDLRLDVHVHEKNRGYGANQKTCYGKALATDADIVVMLHPDYQYDPRLIPGFVHFVQAGVCDVMLGSRIRTRKEALDGGMPMWRYINNRLLTLLENLVLGQNLGDFHSGFRVYRREVLETIPYGENSDDFVFDSQVLAQCVYFGFKLGDAPIPVRYFEEASSINLPRSIRYGLGTVAVVLKFLLARMKIFRSKEFRRIDAAKRQ